jgi:hypothetical protein
MSKDAISNHPDMRLLCGACRIAPDIGSDTRRDRMATCPGCGRSDSFGAVLREAGRFLAGRIVCDGIAMSPRVEGGRFRPAGAARSHEGSFRWVAA